MAKTAKKSLFLFFVLTIFALLFGAFLAVGAYYYLTGKEGVTLASLSPGLPAIYLGFMARREWQGMRAARKVEAFRRRKAEAPAE